MTWFERFALAMIPVPAIVVTIWLVAASALAPSAVAPTTGRVIGYVRMGIGPRDMGGYAVTLGAGEWKIYLLDGSVIGRLHVAIQQEGASMGPLVPLIVGPDD